MNCSTLGEVLIQRGWAHVDFLSLDVEGHEARASSAASLQTAIGMAVLTTSFARRDVMRC